jgi:hypothetical protein
VLKFLVFNDGLPLREFDVTPSYLIGQDEIPIRSQIKSSEGILYCQKSSDEAAAVAVLWEVKGCGKFLLQTTRLPDREKPYVLNLELARWRLMRIIQKIEDWGLFDYPQIEPINELIDGAKGFLIRALQNEEAPGKAAELADQSLALSMKAGETLAKFYSVRMLVPRLQSGNISRKLLGCRIVPAGSPESLSEELLSTMNFFQIPISWQEFQPTRQQYNLNLLDRWFELLLKRKITIKLGTVISFSEENLPTWLKGKNVEFETLRDLVYDYLTSVANRYGKFIRSWTILSGIHFDNPFCLSFEQVLDITRLACIRAKQLCPRATSVIDIIYPWGEYYSGNARSIHPFMYADMVTQSGINFDAIGLKVPMGACHEGFYTRDFFQLSSLIDRYAILGKPIHLTVAAPSEVTQSAGDSHQPPHCCGYWEEKWSPEIQGKWFELFFQTAISKPQVESITWDSIFDGNYEPIPKSGIFYADGTPKPIFSVMKDLQKKIFDTRNINRSD